MATDEPFDAFDPSLKKKKKKKTVAFSEDPLGADADPTSPAPPFDDGELGPATVHEQMKQNGRAAEAEDVGAADDFSDLKKKKKKKKEIPMDLVSVRVLLLDSRVLTARYGTQAEDGSGASTPLTKEGDIDDLEFSALKKKKKKEIPLDLVSARKNLYTTLLTSLLSREKKVPALQRLSQAMRLATISRNSKRRRNPRRRRLHMTSKHSSAS